MERNVFGTCISVFLDVIELFVSQIFEDEYCSILYNIDTIFKILGWLKKKKYLERVSMLLDILNIFVQYSIFIFHSRGI